MRMTALIAAFASLLFLAACPIPPDSADSLGRNTGGFEDTGDDNGGSGGGSY